MDTRWNSTDFKLLGSKTLKLLRLKLLYNYVVNIFNNYHKLFQYKIKYKALFDVDL